MKFSEMVINAKSEIMGLNVSTDFEVNNLRYDSKLVEKGDVFFAIKGYKTDGNKYIHDALSKGANAVITDSIEFTSDVRIFKVLDCRKTMAEMSNSFYNYPSRKLKIIGVTGTNGKTTVTSLINFVLEFAGKRTGLIGTNGNIINKKSFESTHTTPESVDLNGLLNQMVNSGVEYVIIEVSSHALELKRVYGIEFDAAIFTNLTPEHLDFHKTMNDYFYSKKILFDSIQRINNKGNNTVVIYNSDDEYGGRIIENSESERISFGFNPALYSIQNLNLSFEGMSFDMLIPLNGEDINKLNVKSKQTGRFNVYNILASTAALKYLGLSYGLIKNAIENFNPVDGRFNQIKLQNSSMAIIDYSHTPDSLQKAITTIREIIDVNKIKGKIITVFGCGGNRDRTKRPIMGKIATRFSDQVIITSDNPRDEEPMDIISEIKMGITSDNYSVEQDREKAIIKAYKMSKKNDVILIAGKGHESYQEIKGVKHHLSDREIVEKYI
jgi:UDP-N-acetylmuramoyl-L-alanyl-D-glutamate--2,6-diaminopimelate ligase